MSVDLELSKQGAVNLVVHCAEVQNGERVVMISERGRVHGDLPVYVAEAVEDAGGEGELLWVEALPEGLAFTDEQMTVLSSADKVIASVRDTSCLRDSLKGADVALLVWNLFTTVDELNPESLASEHARYPWKIAKAIHDRLEELFIPGRKWRITAPSGTDLSGVFGDFSARASYREDLWDEWSGRSRTFHGSVYRPVASLEANGVIVGQFTGGSRRVPVETPPIFVIEKNELVTIEGEAKAQVLIEQYKRNLDVLVGRFGKNATLVDSWHGGTHPRAEPAQNLLGNACTQYMHFHLGRTTGIPGDYITAEISDHTIEIDGRPIYKNGELLVLDEPELQSIAPRSKRPNGNSQYRL